MTFPIYGKIKNVPNHQPDIFRGWNPLWNSSNRLVTSGFPRASSCSGPGAFRDGWPGNRVRKGATLMTERLQQVWVYRFKKKRKTFLLDEASHELWMMISDGWLCSSWHVEILPMCVAKIKSLLQYQFHHFMGATPYDYIHPLDLTWNPPKLADMAISCKSTVRQKLGHRAGWELEDF